MKRDPLSRSLARIKVKKPWFWRRCDSCEADYKLVKMWRILTMVSGHKFNVWACFTCYPDTLSVLQRWSANSIVEQYKARLAPAGPLDFK